MYVAGTIVNHHHQIESSYRLASKCLSETFRHQPTVTLHPAEAISI